MEPQIIVCGLGRTGYCIFSILRQQGLAVTGISDRPLHEPTEDIVVGDVRCEEVLIAAGIRTAQTLLLAGADDALNLAVMTKARLLNPQIRIVNRLFNARLGHRLDRTLSDHISMSVSALVAPIFAFSALGNRAIGQLHLFERSWPIEEEIIDHSHPWHGLSLKTLWVNPSRMLIAYEAADYPLDLMTAIMEERPLQAGDRLLISNRPGWRKPRRSLQQRWRSFLSGVIQFRRQSRAVLLVMLALLLTIGVATLTYISASSGVTLVDALYFSVGMITGAGGQEAVAENASSLVKVFTAVMMLVGAGVIGICYALLNDFVLGTHLQQVWTAARVPLSGHHIVCGLGGVGIRIVDQFKAVGEELIAIEQNPNGRFLSAAQSQKTPMLIADASVPATLRSANIQKAASLLAVTSDDTVNLEVAITAKSLVPRLPVLVRIHDPTFAKQIQQVFDFDMVMSPTGLAAPAFAAAAIGGRVFGNCMTSTGLWIAIATLITPNHPFCDRILHEAAAAEKFTPLYAEWEDQRIHGQRLLNHRLVNGTVLYLMMPASRWEQIWTSGSERLTSATSNPANLIL
ncbi:MAG: potassium channel protein [Leptolyngbya sp. SIO4C1]|nr:potassium channel protein [Leptolyngbya sp. SIO4C1]